MTTQQAACGTGFGPYTVLDLHDLPEDGKGFELEDGWLIEVAAGARHNFIGISLADIIRVAAADADIYVCMGGDWEISTPSGVRKPDIVVVPRAVARAAIIDECPKLIPGTEVLLAVEVVSPGSGSERTDRVRKVREYAALGIPEYWIVEQYPQIGIHRLVLDGGTYRAAPVVASGTTFVADVEADKTFRVMFDPADLLDI